MFEALRGLRDAVAPESGNLGAQTTTDTNPTTDPNTTSSDEPPDAEELWQAYRVGDPGAVQLLESTAAGAASTTGRRNLLTRDDVVRLHAQLEESRDTALVTQLAATVLQKSRDIDTALEQSIPGIDRTRTQQMTRIQDLLQQNNQALEELSTLYRVAQTKQAACRTWVRQSTSVALDIEEEEVVGVSTTAAHMKSEPERMDTTV
uniref:Mediator of RNA polymerase II transcription subunit 21 n=1 Tax=Entomoneis paludosa TaxID=265537 RepID=A0A7S3DX73_9STRA|mmetsp:Transcript_822/g.1966  ORF Transcript_822/g.1966 Transcript_822/m.1966 type:complete len:205 (+) Transcript_822:546-1160(+)|eukprot:CAMPEP_0172457492 /NCGR_PEP_ID=MMETSP1065-20121228/22654_1 /TAXON_ID=265537 /ORGANISM="Amphiprora paludosa, Strain CCMP125" /LENGTH=204 /DNA_ID=CAMNT_0013211279 /DNA_START=483 /DNA_END=1097 /DNA_ORIENTATION=-